MTLKVDEGDGVGKDAAEVAELLQRIQRGLPVLLMALDDDCTPAEREDVLNRLHRVADIFDPTGARHVTIDVIVAYVDAASRLLGIALDGDDAEYDRLLGATAQAVAECVGLTTSKPERIDALRNAIKLRADHDASPMKRYRALARVHFFVKGEKISERAVGFAVARAGESIFSLLATEATERIEAWLRDHPSPPPGASP